MFSPEASYISLNLQSGGVVEQNRESIGVLKCEELDYWQNWDKNRVLEVVDRMTDFACKQSASRWGVARGALQ